MKNRFRPRVAVYRIAVIVSAAVLAAVAFAAEADRIPRPARADRALQEPSGRVQMGPRILSRADRGDHFRVLVEVSLSASLRVPPARVTARRPDGTVLAVQDLRGAMPPRGLRRVVLDLALEKGREHHIFFDLAASSGEPRSSGSDPVWSTAYLRVNLDPDKEPRDLGDVLEYRALRQEGSR